MSFFAVFLALLLEQARPLDAQNWVHAGLRGWLKWVRFSFDAGQTHHGALVWGMAVGLPVLLVAVVHMLLWTYSVVLTFLWTVVVLYFTLGFRQFSHHFTQVRGALERGDEPAARQALADWQGMAVDEMPTSGLVRHAIDCSALAVHKHVLGVLVCFVALWVLGLGPAGAVLFRLSDYLAGICRPSQSGAVALVGVRQSSESVFNVANAAWRLINHVPARATALAFAVVGNFEEAVASWRQQASAFADQNDGVVLSATAGALNLKVGPGLSEADSLFKQPQLAHLTSLVGLVWRSVVLWMIFLALVTLAHSVG